MQLGAVLRARVRVLVLLGVLFISSTLLLNPDPCMGPGNSWGTPLPFYAQCYPAAPPAAGDSGMGPAEVRVPAFLLDLAFWYVVSSSLVLLFHVTTPPWERRPRDSE